MSGKLVILGAGGHAKVVASTAIEAGFDIYGVYDDDRQKWGTSILGLKIKGPMSSVQSLPDVNAVIAVGDNTIRKSIAEKFSHLRWISIVHPQSFVHPSVHLGVGAVVFAKAVIQPDTVIGEHCILNTGSTVDHDCMIGPYVHVAPGVNLAGEVVLNEGVFCGIGASIIGRIHVGTWTQIGAGTVVIRDLPDYSIAVGAPARIIRSVR